MSRQLKQIVRIAFILGAAALLYLMFKDFELSQLLQSAVKVSVPLIIAVVALQVITQLAVNLQWTSIGKTIGVHVSFCKMLDINCRGNVIEAITPGAKIGGEVTRAMLLKKIAGTNGTQAAAFVTIQKLISMSAFFMLNIAALLYISSRVSFLQPLSIRLPLSIFLVLLLIFFITILFVPSLWENTINKWTPKRKAGIALKKYFVLILQNAAMFKSRPLIWIVHIALGLGIWFLYPLKLYILVNAFMPKPDILFLSALTYISYMLAMVPILPGGAGSFEAAMTAMLTAAGMLLADAAVVTLIFRFITFWLVILLSLLYSPMYSLVYRKRQKKRHAAPETVTEV